MTGAILGGSVIANQDSKNRANTNKMNFPTLNGSIVLKENSAAQQRWKRTKESSLMWEGPRDFQWQ